jgi:hypothetical protein
MAQLTDSNASSSGIFGAIKGAYQLFQGLNKTPTSGDQSVTAADEYESTYSEEKVSELVSNWKKLYQSYYADIESTQDTAFSYWIGKHKTDALDDLEGVRIVDNRIFSSLETFLPIATRANPDPLVSGDDSPEGQSLAKDVKNALVHLADKLKLRMKLKSATRNWAINRIGVLRIDYDYIKDEIDIISVHPKRLLLDPNGHIDESGYFTGDWIGERVPVAASRLETMFPSKKAAITKKAMDKKGTKLEIIKWWYRGTDTFYTLDNLVLAKRKNAHWNWDAEVSRIDAETGEEIKEPVQGRNHFALPMAPYVFLGVFKTGIQPHDDTSLILQNITLQDQVNKRYKQLDRNVDSQNNGIVVDGRLMDQAQAAEAASAKRKGAAIRVMGDVRSAVSFDSAPNIASDVWGVLQDARSELEGIFGITGSTAQGLQKEDSVRGKIMANQQDSSRIGGGITEYIEQVADSTYNWMVQMMYVHYDDEHYFSTVGIQQGQEMIALKNSRFIKGVVVTVKEGSLIPKDPLTKRNEAIDLWSAGAIDPIALYTRLEDPDPMERTKQLILWQQIQKGDMSAIAQYLPNFQVTPGQQMQAAAIPGGTPVNPLPDGQNATPEQSNAVQPPVEAQSKELLNAVPIK